MKLYNAYTKKDFFPMNNFEIFLNSTQIYGIGIKNLILKKDFGKDSIEFSFKPNFFVESDLDFDLFLKLQDLVKNIKNCENRIEEEVKSCIQNEASKIDKNIVIEFELKNKDILIAKFNFKIKFGAEIKVKEEIKEEQKKEKIQLKKQINQKLFNFKVIKFL